MLTSGFYARLTLHSCIACLLPEMTYNHVSVGSHSEHSYPLGTEMCVWFVCRSQGSRVGEKTSWMWVYPPSHLKPIIMPPDPQVKPRGRGSRVDSRPPATRPRNDSVRGRGFHLSVGILFSCKYLHHRFESKMFLATLQSSRFALAYLTWAFGRSRSCEPDLRWVCQACGSESCRPSEDHSFSILPCI